ncbi:MAG: flavin reductase family protein [Fimbriimonadaceae bacterium]|nr:flavin reductase family protein [Fimbriimonadaceae bacterium]
MAFSLSPGTYDAATMPPGDLYRVLTQLVVPRPIALVSSVSGAGVQNLAPFSFFMVGGSNPGSVVVSPTLNGQGQPKDTLRNVRETAHFVVNLVDRAMVDGMNQASRNLPPDESEWGWTAFSAVEGAHGPAWRVAESPASLECRLHQVVEHGVGPSAARYIIGEVLALHVTRTDGAMIARLGGPDYLDLRDGTTFALSRPS